LAKSSTDKQPVWQRENVPATLMPLVSLTKLRIDRLEAALIASRTLRLDPNRAKLLTEMLEPNVANEKDDS
jgi:hypothetical protein